MRFNANFAPDGFLAVDESHVVNVSSGGRPAAWRWRIRPAETASLFSQMFLSLSQACLGKLIVFMQEMKMALLRIA